MGAITTAAALRASRLRTRPTAPVLAGLAGAATVLAVALAPAAAADTSRGPRPGLEVPAARPLEELQSSVFGGLSRTDIVHVPPAASTHGPMPLVLVFHGHGGTAAAMEETTGFDALSDRDGFVVVYPQGYEDSWNDGRGTTEAALAGVDDVAYVRSLVHRLEAQLPIDPDRVYATGFSNGAIFTELLGCDLSGMFAGIATVAGPLAADAAPNCHPSHTLPVFVIQGTSDPVVPFDGGTATSSVGGVVLSTAATESFWLRHDGCEDDPSSSAFGAPPADGVSVRMLTFAHCLDGASVQVARIIGGVHEWPESPTAATTTTQQAVRPFGVTAAVWRFLRQFSRPSTPAGSSPPTGSLG